MASGTAGHVFNNWSLTERCEPMLYFEPSCEADLRQVLEKARFDKKMVKVVGRGLSVNGINCTDDYMISLKNMNNIIKVLELCLMLSDGETLTLTRQDTDNDVFHAACLSLGALGVIVSVKLQCEPAFRLEQITKSAKLDDVMSNIDSYVMSSDHFRFTWFPHTDRCVVFQINRTTEQEINTNSKWFWDTFVGFNWLMEFLFWLSTFVPFLIPWINKCYSRLLTRPRHDIRRSDHMFTFPCVVRNVCTEWSAPRSRVVSVMEGLKQLADCVYIHFPVDVRFVKRSSNCMLSPHADWDAVYFNILAWHPYGKNSQLDKVFEAVDELMLSAGARPHWAKKHGMTSEQLRTIYKSFDRFIEIRNKLDPNKMFTNSYLKRVLGD